MTHTPRGYCIEDLEEGMSATYGKTITEADVVLFAGISGDDNPIHIDEEYARDTIFKGRVVHGMFLAGLISCVVGTRLPGPGAIYMGQTLKFLAPVRIGDTVRVVATVTDVNREKRRVKLLSRCMVGETVVAEGEGMLMVESREQINASASMAATGATAA